MARMLCYAQRTEMNNTNLQSSMTEDAMIAKSAPSILIVEDEQLVRWSLSHALTKAGFNITTVSTGEIAMEKLKSCHYDLVITDVNLPQLNGFEVAKQVKKYSPHVPVILTSAIGEEESRMKVNMDMIDSFIEKPFDLNDVTKTVTQLLSVKNESFHTNL